MPADGGARDAPTADRAGELERLALELARGAAEVVRAGRGDALVLDAGSVASKSTSTDLVTDIDRASERWLAEQLSARRPGDAVLGEEGGERAGTTGVRWLLDPIDGTVNFVLGIPQFAVSVAAEIDGTAVAGAVCNPATGETFHARRGGGAYLLAPGRPAVRLGGPREVTLPRAVIATGFAYARARRERQAAVVARLLAQVADVRRLGAAALDLCFLAAGRVDGYFEAGLSPWDHAAGGLIASEAGCVLSGLRDRPASGELFAAAGAGLAPELFALLETLGADAVG